MTENQQKHQSYSIDVLNIGVRLRMKQNLVVFGKAILAVILSISDLLTEIQNRPFIMSKNQPKHKGYSLGILEFGVRLRMEQNHTV